MSTVVGAPPGVFASGYRATPPPIPLTNIVSWFDATRDADFSYSAGSDPGNPGNKYVSQWRDRSGNNNHANGSGNPGYHPKRDVTINGLKAIDFGVSYIAVQKGLEVPTVNYTKFKPASFFFVIRAPSPIKDDAWLHGNGVQVRTRGGGYAEVLVSGVGQFGNVPLVANEQCLLTFTFSVTGDYKLKKNGTTISSGNYAASPGSGTGALGASDSSGSNSFAGIIGEHVHYSAVLSDPDIATVEAYLIAKWFPYADVLLEPFSNFTFAPWTNTSGTIVAGRTGNAASFAGSSANARYTIPLASESDTITIGFAFKFLVAGATPPILDLIGDNFTTSHNTLNYDGSNGRLNVQRGATQLGTTPIGVIALNTWAYIELQMRLHDTDGTVIIRVNGVTQLSLTGLDTRNGGTKTTYDTVRIGPRISGATSLYDDLYITMGPGAPFKGSITVP